MALHDVDTAAFARASERIRNGLARRAARLELDPDTIDIWVDGRLARLRPGESLEELAATSGIVIEAAREDLATKRDLFRTLDGAAAPDVILATNTSALSIGEIAAAAGMPDRVLGLHFFNPAPVMPLVEVVIGPTTAPAVADRAVALMTAWGKTPVRCTDTPGFIVNRVNRPFTIEALRILESGAAGVDAIDEAMRAAGYPMGPFELMDLIGVDVNLAVAESIWEGLGRPDRLRPSPIQRATGRRRPSRAKDRGWLLPLRRRSANRQRSGGGRRRPLGERAGSPRTIGERIETAIRAEAHLAAAAGVASEADIDLAMRLGAGHPRGPFEREAGG